MGDKFKCVFCDKEVEEFIPKYCCDSLMCGCMGEPIDPPVHKECWEQWVVDFKNIKEDVKNERN